MNLLRKIGGVFFLIAQTALLLQLGCAGGPGGGNLAAPPAPIAEIPSLLQIPKDLSIDVSKTASDAGGLTLLTLLNDPYLDVAFSKFLTAGACGDGTLNTGEQCDNGKPLPGDNCSDTCHIENFSEAIAFSANQVFFANARLVGVLGPLSAILIPVDINLHEMEAVIFIGSTAYVARLNFADFDLDGQGGTEGCFGNTAELPICVRVWVDDGTTESRLLAARFDEFPLPENPGAGNLRGQDITFGGVDSSAQVAANYNHLNPEDKFTDSFFGFLQGDPPEAPFTLRAFASQLGPDDSALKTTNGNGLEKELSGDFFGKGFGRWLENEDFWIGSFEANDPPQKITDQCARISTGEGVSTAAFCDPLKLNTAGLDFLPFVTANDLVFFDFPPSAP